MSEKSDYFNDAVVNYYYTIMISGSRNFQLDIKAQFD